MNPALQEVTQALKKFEHPEAALVIKKYMSSQLAFFGVSVPQQRKIEKQGFSFYQKSEQEILSIWDAIWKTSRNFDVMSLPLFYYTHPSRSHDFKIWPVVKTWTSQIDNWAHSDYFSKIVADLLEEHPKIVFPQLRAWNQSPHPWERRLSIVGLLAFGARGRKRIPPFALMIKLVKNLLYDTDTFVQKAVGWSLREIGQVYPAQTQAFIRRHVHELSSAAYTSATEKWPPRKKAAFTQQRKRRRSSTK